MTNELEKTFFDMFGIRAYYKYLLIDKTSRCHNEKLFDKQNFIDFIKSGKDYLLLKVIKYHPQITDRILLELMELLMKQQATEFYYNDEYLFSSKLLGSNRPTCNRVKNLRELVLITANCLGGFAPLKDKMLKQVRTLFEEG